MFDLAGPRALLSLGGLDFEITSTELPLCRRREEHYVPFRPAGRRGGDTVPVRLTLGPPPPTAGLPRLFEGGEAWALFADGGVRLAVSPPPRARERGEPHWAARIDPEGRSVEIFCGAGLVREFGEGHAVEDPVRYPLDQILTMYLLGGDGVGVESSWGLATDGERNGLTASDTCGETAKEITGSCP